MTTILGFCFQSEHLAKAGGLDTHIAYFLWTSKFQVALVFILFAFLIIFIGYFFFSNTIFDCMQTSTNIS